MFKPLLPLPELLAGLEEECSELAQAALKLRRFYTQTNPTPIDEETALDGFMEEIADVELYLDQISYSKTYVEFTKKHKLERWKARLGMEE